MRVRRFAFDQSQDAAGCLAGPDHVRLIWVKNLSRAVCFTEFLAGWDVQDCSAGGGLPGCLPPTITSAFEPQLCRLREVIAPMNSSTVYEVIAGIAMIITGLFLGYDEFWGVLMILLGVVLLVLWLARMGWL